MTLNTLVYKLFKKLQLYVSELQHVPLMGGGGGGFWDVRRKGSELSVWDYPDLLEGIKYQLPGHTDVCSIDA